MIIKSFVVAVVLVVMAVPNTYGAEDMDAMWGRACVKLRAEDAQRG